MLRFVAVVAVFVAAPPTAPSQVDVQRASEVRRYIDDALAAGSDAVRIHAVLKKWYTPAAVKEYIENRRNCLSELRTGAPPSLTCRGNGLTCTEDDATVTIVAAAGAEATVTLVERDAETRLTLQLEARKRPRIRSLTCADPAAPETTSAAAAAVRGHCAGTAVCGDACDAVGCHRVGQRCAGVPLSCELRSATSCAGQGCQWVP